VEALSIEVSDGVCRVCVQERDASCEAVIESVPIEFDNESTNDALSDTTSVSDSDVELDGVSCRVKLCVLESVCVRPDLERDFSSEGLLDCESVAVAVAVGGGVIVGVCVRDKLGSLEGDRVPLEIDKLSLRVAEDVTDVDVDFETLKDSERVADSSAVALRVCVGVGGGVMLAVTVREVVGVKVVVGDNLEWVRVPLVKEPDLLMDRSAEGLVEKVSDLDRDFSSLKVLVEVGVGGGVILLVTVNVPVGFEGLAVLLDELSPEGLFESEIVALDRDRDIVSVSDEVSDIVPLVRVPKVMDTEMDMVVVPEVEIDLESDCSSVKVRVPLLEAVARDTVVLNVSESVSAAVDDAVSVAVLVIETVGDLLMLNDLVAVNSSLSVASDRLKVGVELTLIEVVADLDRVRDNSSENDGVGPDLDRVMERLEVMDSESETEVVPMRLNVASDLDKLQDKLADPKLSVPLGSSEKVPDLEAVARDPVSLRDVDRVNGWLTVGGGVFVFDTEREAVAERESDGLPSLKV
jgi:hypothetical protein